MAMKVTGECSICLVNMARRPVIKLNPCGHFYHKTCWESQEQWRQENGRNTGSCYICLVSNESVEDYERKKYKKASVDARSIIVKTSRELLDWKALAKTMGVNYKTAHHWVTSGRETALPRTNTIRKALSEEEIDGLISHLEGDPALTLQQMSAYVLQTHNKSVSGSTIARYLHGRVFSYKGNHYEPVDMNCEAKKVMRRDYLHRLLQYMGEGV